MISNNLAYTEEDNHQTVRWSVNLKAISDNAESICGYESYGPYQGPSFFINGAESVRYSDDVYLKEFPNAKLHTVEGAGHYIYNDKAITTAKLLTDSLEIIEKY